jgi:hypothetical protein
MGGRRWEEEDVHKCGPLAHAWGMARQREQRMIAVGHKVAQLSGTTDGNGRDCLRYSRSVPPAFMMDSVFGLCTKRRSEETCSLPDDYGKKTEEPAKKRRTEYRFSLRDNYGEHTVQRPRPFQKLCPECPARRAHSVLRVVLHPRGASLAASLLVSMAHWRKAAPSVLPAARIRCSARCSTRCSAWCSTRCSAWCCTPAGRVLLHRCWFRWRIGAAASASSLQLGLDALCAVLCRLCRVALRTQIMRRSERRAL